MHSKPIPPPPSRAQVFTPDPTRAHVRPVSRPKPVLSTDDQRRFRAFQANRRATARMNTRALMSAVHTGGRVSGRMGTW